MATFSLGAAFFFKGGSRKPKAKQLHEQWERGGEYEFPMVKKNGEKKKKKWQQPWTEISKNIYFSFQTLRRGLREQQGWGGYRDRNSLVVHWGLLDRNALYPDWCRRFTTQKREMASRRPHTCSFLNCGIGARCLSVWFVLAGGAVSLSELRKDLGCSGDVTGNTGGSALEHHSVF